MYLVDRGRCSFLITATRSDSSAAPHGITCEGTLADSEQIGSKDLLPPRSVLRYHDLRRFDNSDDSVTLLQF